MQRWNSRLPPPPPGVSPTRPGAGSGSFSRQQLQSAQWRRVGRGLYVPADTPDTTSQRIVEAAALLPACGAVGGWAAAYWAGVTLLDGSWSGAPTPVPLCLGPRGNLRCHPDVALNRARLLSDEIVEVRGVPVTIPVRTAFDGARLARSLVEAVVFLDMLLAAGALTKDALAQYLPEHRPAWKGVDQARRALALTSDASASPPESRLRLLWTRKAGLPAPLVNAPVFGLDEQLLGIVDLLGEEAGTVAEYDGADHRDLINHTSDNAREERLEDAGLVVTRLTALDMRRPDLVVQRLTSAWSRGMARDRRRDRWTLEQPEWFRRRAA